MNWLDIVLTLILGCSVLAGLMKGFAKEGIGFLAAILGLFCGLWFYGSAGSFLLPYVSSKSIANLIGFLLVFLFVILMGALLGKLLGMLFKWAGISWLDRLLGGVFGILKGGVLGVALVLALMAFSPKPPPRSVIESRIAPYVVDSARFCAAVAPREVKDAVEDSYEKVRRAWSDLLRGTSRKAPDTEI